MAGEDERVNGGEPRRYPRCEVCRKVVRIQGVGIVGVLCKNCLGSALPFVGLVSETEYRGALREYRQGLGSRAGDFQGLRLDPFDDEIQGIIGGVNVTLNSCAYFGGDEVRNSLKQLAKDDGCSLSMMCHNIRSAKGPGLELLESEIRRWGVQWDVLGLTETWLDKESERRVTIQGYDGVFASRKEKNGGGVALFVKDGRTFRERPDLSVFREGIFESLFVELVKNEGCKNEVVGIVYRPPGANLEAFSEELVKVLELTKGTNSYIMGDFNMDLLKLSAHKPTSDFMENFTSRGFFPLISLPTRITDTTASLIDNIWTNNLTAKIGSGLITVRVSDHLPIFANVGGSENSHADSGRPSRKRLINGQRIMRFKEDLLHWTFDEERQKGIEYNVAKFRNEFRDLYDSAFPWVENKKKRRDKEKPWLDDLEFKSLVEEKGKLYKMKLRGSLGEEGHERLAVLNKEVNRLRKSLKRSYFREKLEEKKDDLRGLWEVLGEALSGRSGKSKGSICKYFMKDGKAITDGAAIADEFCKFYCQIGPNLAAKVPKVQAKFEDYLGERIQESLILSPTSPLEVEQICLALDSQKGMGWDGVSPRVIKGVAKELSGSLSRLYNSCMREGFYPDSFKVARVVPVFKAEDPTEFSNYRPVSVLPVLSQIFERVIRNRIVNFLDANEVLIPEQFGFRPGHSTAMAVLEMVEKIRKAWSNKNTAVGVFLDLKKAFDTVDHKILLAKLEHYGIRGTALKLLGSYLDGRSQYVNYAGYESERGPLECGVPQGSVLGPLFFLLYVNDMVRASSNLNLVLFADDTNAFAEGKNLSEVVRKVNEGLSDLSVWFRCNKLTLNLKKTEYVHFRGPGVVSSSQEGIKIGNESIGQVNGVKFLGVWIDEGLRWTGQIDKVRSKVSQLLGVVGRARPNLGRRATLSLYNGLVLPQLQYCLLVWGDFQGGRNKIVGDNLLRLQKRFANVIEGSGTRLHSDPLFAKYGMLKVEDLYRQQMRVHAW